MANQEYAISAKHFNTEEILKKLDNLVNIPMRPLKKNAMQEYLNYYEKKCVKSKELNEKAKKLIPGGVQHNLAFNYPFPLCIEKTKDAYLWDVDGNRYIDFLQAGGPTLLGNNYAPLREKVFEVVTECGPVTGLFHEYEYKLAEIINQYMPAVEMFRSLGTGTESNMVAIRLARTFTGNKKIIKVGGAYHGWSDQLLFGLHVPGTGSMEAVGIPRGCLKDTQEFHPNDIEALEKLLKKNKEKGGTACVLLEPVGPESGTRPIYKDFNKQVRELCTQYDSLLVFDEVVTGFRLGMGGGQGYFKIIPDITTFGKIVAGGYPMAGGIGGRADIIKYLAAGVETGKKRAYCGGTLSANPLSCAAGYWAIRYIAETKAYLQAGKMGDLLTKGLSSLIEQYKLPYVAYNQASLVHLESSGAMLVDITQPGALKQAFERKQMMEEMGAAYTANGMITIGGSRIYTNMMDTKEIIETALEGFDSIFQNVRKR
ncbi:MAG: aminotransferase class III-fold pyridoxal phosphate-dependent enzyme [Candidatus Lokiarchaeota archaeon]|nr:aminotransferase class III-fold pyridoxal phosphate-dependent enzyme [Candidatus Lokiarchaeota archaeon]